MKIKKYEILVEIREYQKGKRQLPRKRNTYERLLKRHLMRGAKCFFYIQKSTFDFYSMINLRYQKDRSRKKKGKFAQMRSEVVEANILLQQESFLLYNRIELNASGRQSTQTSALSQRENGIGEFILLAFHRF